MKEILFAVNNGAMHVVTNVDYDNTNYIYVRAERAYLSNLAQRLAWQVTLENARAADVYWSIDSIIDHAIELMAEQIPMASYLTLTVRGTDVITLLVINVQTRSIERSINLPNSLKYFPSLLLREAEKQLSKMRGM